MRVLHIVTLISSDGAYGGPARVALNQADAVTRLGHEVTVAAGVFRHDDAANECAGTHMRLHPVRRLAPGTGFAGIAAPGLTWWLSREVAHFDVVHVHLGRDLVTLPAAMVARCRAVPFVVQTHGMIAPSRHALAPLLDRACTRPVLRAADAAFYLNDVEKRQLIDVAGPALRLEELRNGVPEYPESKRTHDGPVEVLFVGRLHPRKRPIIFVQMARDLLDQGFDTRFTLVGPDEGEGDAVLAAIAGEPRIRWDGALSPNAVPSRIAAADIFVLPAVREPFPMAVLEAMSVGLPVVVASDCGLADTITRTCSGIVADSDVSGMTTAVRTFLTDPGLVRRMGARGRETVVRDFAMSSVADALLRVYRRIQRAPR